MKKSRLLIVLAVTFGSLPLVAMGAKRDTASTADLSLISAVMQLVEQDYVHSVSDDELTKDALKGMLSRLDPHSDYMSAQEFKEVQADLTGNFGGLGMQLSQQDGLPKVISPIDNTPASHAGIQPGDLIVAIDGKTTHGEGLTKVVRILRGKPGTTVRLTISRGSNTPFDVTLTRSMIRVESVKSKIELNNIGYIRVSQFTDTTAADFKRALQVLKQRANGRLNGLVIDLRNDPGGLLSAAVDVAGDFLDGGKVVTIHGRMRDSIKSFDAPSRGDQLQGTPIVVLVNGASASASEIVAGALQDRHRATIMGTQTFGKGSVQSIIPLGRYGALRLTTALYYTPAGRSIQGQGIAPDVVVEAPKEQQVAGALMLRESTLQGAFTNPGPLEGPAKPEQPDQNSDTGNAISSAPIKGELIGTPEDEQLKTALSFFTHEPGTSGGALR